MKAKHLFHVLLTSVMLAATAGLTAACTSNDDNPATPSGPSESVIKEKIVGKWKAVTQDGTERVTDKLYVMTFNADGTMTYSSSTFFQNLSKYTWRNKAPFTYSISGNVLTREGQEDGELRKAFYEVTDINDQEMQMVFTSYILDGQTFSRDMKIGYERVTADYSEDIIGMWEVTEMTGEETYNDDNARLAFLADGTYRYYRKDDTGEWQLVSTRDVEEYFVDGDWMATRWQETGGEMNYEWWDIDEIKDGQMKWSALREREDGTRFTTTFTWRKVDDIAFAIDEEHFPDANFRAALMKENFGKDGVVTEEERKRVKGLYVQKCNIHTLKGIELFTELATLLCFDNQLTSLDVSRNTKLTEFQCQANQLKELDLTENTKLSAVACDKNQLTSLKVANLDRMRTLICQNNQLETIDITGCKSLMQFDCYNNRIRGAGMDAFVASLYSYPDDPLFFFMEGSITVVDTESDIEQNAMTKAQVAAAKAKGWNIFDYKQGKREDGHPPYYEGIE